jgi:hypothetical protein
MQATHDISALFAQAHLLEENEFVALQPVFFMLRGFRHASEISTEMAELLQARLTEAVAAIDKHWRYPDARKSPRTTGPVNEESPPPPPSGG